MTQPGAGFPEGAPDADAVSKPPSTKLYTLYSEHSPADTVLITDVFTYDPWRVFRGVKFKRENSFIYQNPINPTSKYNNI